ncbi:hypothetical protein [Cryobacterium roopkundense]|uniref:Uncharacterized protein n=1 Tax=Cryobacterium roopkundense TaxID=1001240 RepID=A0A7W8ZYC6_9MICO|nr:hypothetical protein [Cryobacterium roopkundense]MBB5642313.1 hypothetical protein [Cryobacterium roopkundense]
MHPFIWFVLALSSFVVMVATFVVGAAASGLDVVEKCAEAGQSIDRAYLEEHRREFTRIFPMHSMCSATFDLVPAWVNPVLLIAAVLTLVLSTSCIVSTIARAKSRHQGRSVHEES